MTARRLGVLVVAGFAIAIGVMAVIGSPRPAPEANTIRFNDGAGTPIGPNGLAVGSYRVVDDSANDVNPPGAAKQLSAEARLNLSREMGYGDDGTWCGWWVGKDPEGTGSVADDTVANDGEVVTITTAMVGLTLWGDCIVIPAD